jgi:MOSC domain-containing protein YiiM/GNAT superfamily N-acetyltransferase
MGASGLVRQVSVSAGGVPKLPVSEAWVNRLGLAGDGHHDRTTHGGPHRAVCLFALEAIARLQAEGHPVAAGGVGENLTTSGIEWSLLPVGTRARIGADLVIELASAAGPCATQRANFADGNFNRIAIDRHPTDARMYARVLHEGVVRPGDPIELLPVATDSRAQAELLLDRLDWAAAKSSLAEWRMLVELGHDLRIVDDGELVMVAASGSALAPMSHAFGLARLPNLLADAQAFYDAQATAGCLITEGPPWPGAVADTLMDVFAAAPAEVGAAAGPAGLAISRIEPADSDGWQQVRRLVLGDEEGGPTDQPEFAQRLAANSHVVMLLASLDGRPAGTGRLYIGHRTAWLRGAAVVPSARRLGIHRALIAARARAAVEAGCDLIGAWAIADTGSARNLAASGLRRIGSREHHRYLPPALGAAPA